MSDEERRHSNDYLLGQMNGELRSIKAELVDNVNPKIDAIQAYNTLQNGNIATAIEKCAKQSEYVTRNTTWINAFKWIIIIVTPSLGAALIYCLAQIF